VIAFVTIAAGLPVRVLSPHAERHDAIIPLIRRNPERLPPPELLGSLPTPLEAEARREPIVIDPVPPASQLRVMWSFMQLVRYITEWVRLKLTGKLDEQLHAVKTRQLFERMSGIWIKVGQLLSLRSDVMSQAMVQQLASLQHQARGFPTEVALAVVEEEFQRPVSAVFSHFETEPFAAASIAQVHRATLLRNNRAVVVKIMRPDVQRAFTRDLRLLEAIVSWVTWFGLLKRFRLQEGITEIRAILTEETDYQYEAVNLKRMRKNLKKHGVYVPRVVAELSHRRVLVMEEVPGVLMSQFIRVRRQDPDRAHRWAVLNGIDAKALARRLSVTVLRQILEDNEFHGDLHPGNIMLLSDNRIALIDFGSVGRLSQNTWTLYRYSQAALATRDYARAADLMLMMSPSIAMANSARLRQDMTDALRNWELEALFHGGTYADRSIASMSDRVAKVMAQHRVPLSWSMMRVGRSLSTLDASLQTLVPDADFMSLARCYFRDRGRRMRTLAGRREALAAAMTQVSALVGDARLLLGTGLRNQALRLNGMLDQLTRIRVLVLMFLQHGLLVVIVLLSEAFVFDTWFRYLPDAGHKSILPFPFISFVARALPAMHPFYWILMIWFSIYLLRVLRAVRHSIARLE
jgi:ubiquinone biosynthesis protein